MRLFHYALIPVLDNKHLISQWRECLAIKRQWEKGTLRHRLVNYVKDYNRNYFTVYVFSVISEMKKRNIKYQEKYWDEICWFNTQDVLITGVLHYPEHNDRYLRENLYNLEEKFSRGIISKEEWQKIYDKFASFTKLWEGE